MTTTFPEATLVKGATQSDVTTSGNVDTQQAVAMSISAEGTAHIMSLLTDLYSDPDLAVLREYSSNAKDSHIEAGVTKPIEVVLPTRMNPIFHVEDFGVGMSADTIRTIYSSYGASTKRKDFSQVGAFGLGCKSALTMTQQFTLVSIKDGIKSTVLISRGDDGVGQVNVVSELKTDKPNGVKVSVPIQDINKFNSNVTEFFKWWAPGSVLVDGVQPVSVFSKEFYTFPDGNTHLHKRESRYDALGFKVIMGEIAYHVSFDQLGIKQFGSYRDMETTVRSAVREIIDRNFDLIINIPIGSVDLTPSREELRYSPRTQEFLTSLVDYFAESASTYFSTIVSAATDRREAFKMAVSWEDILGTRAVQTILSSSSNKITWNGEEVVTEFDLNEMGYIFSVIHSDTDSAREYTSYSPSLTGQISISSYAIKMNHMYAYVIRPAETDDKLREKQEKAFRRDLPLWAERTGVGYAKYERYYLIDEAPDSKWFTETGFFEEVSFEEVAAEGKAYRSQERKDRIKGTPKKTEYFYTTYKYVTDLTARPDGSRALVVENTSHLDIPTSGYYFEFKDVKTIGGFKTNGYGTTTDKYNHNSKVMEGMFENGNIPESGVIVQIGKGMTLKALENRTKGKFVRLVDHVQSSAAQTLKSLDTTELIVYTIFNAWATRYTETQAVYYSQYILDYMDCFAGNDVLSEYFAVAKKVCDSQGRYTSLSNLVGKYNWLDGIVTEEQTTKYALKIEKELQKYPLLPIHFGRKIEEHRNGRTKKHVKAYIEATTKEG